MDSQKIDIVDNAIKFFTIIALSKDWEHKSIIIEKNVIDKVLAFIFIDSQQ